MNFRERVADSLALPVKALLDVEVTYDLSTSYASAKSFTAWWMK